jgi:hypothetical protein
VELADAVAELGEQADRVAVGEPGPVEVDLEVDEPRIGVRSGSPG